MRYKPYMPPYAIPEVLRLKAEGQTHSQIAKHFGVSRSRVGQIIKRETQRAQAAERSAAIRNDIRASNDVGRNLSIDDLICVLRLSPRAAAVFPACLKRLGISEFSLRDMMDFLIPLVEHPGDLLDAMPAYRVRMLGQILYADLIKAMSAVDCGEMIRAEWTERKRWLREYLVDTGGFYPYILNGKDAALASTS